MAKNTKGNARGKARDPGLGDAELVLLAGGGQHPGYLVGVPQSMKPATRQRASANLVKRGLAEERPARANEPVWRDQEGERLVLRVTAAGLAAIGIEAEADLAPDPAPAGCVGDGEAAPGPRHPREGSKGALLVSLLTRHEGASIEELVAATGWLPHTTRAALTGLRKRGFEIGREAVDGASRYRIGTPEPAPTPARRLRKPRTAEARAAA